MSSQRYSRQLLRRPWVRRIIRPAAPPLRRGVPPAGSSRPRPFVAVRHQRMMKRASAKHPKPSVPGRKSVFVGAWNPPASVNELFCESEWNGREAQDELIAFNLTERYDAVLLAVTNAVGSFAF